MPNQNSEEQDDWLYQVDLIHITHSIDTPFFLYNQDVIEKNLAIIGGSCTDQLQISYAVMNNPNPSILRIVNDKCLKFEISNVGELRLALRAGIKSEETIFTGAMKEKKEIELAMREGVGTIIAEDIDELQNLMTIATESKWMGSQGIRINASSLKNSDTDNLYPQGIYLEDLLALKENASLDLNKIEMVCISNFDQHGVDPTLYLNELLTRVKLVLPKFRVIYLSSNQLEMENSQLADIIEQIRMKINFDLVIIERGSHILRDASVLITKVQKLEDGDSEKNVLIDTEIPNNVDIQKIQIYPLRTITNTNDGAALKDTKIISQYYRNHHCIYES
ncbi:MAG: hypothetical protein ACXAD7_24835, partial [Candidatus Kariarchaeaceae archaeon]